MATKPQIARTDDEFAACIFKDLFIEDANFILTEGIFNRIKKLDEIDEQYGKALDLYYRCNLSYEKVGELMGFSKSYARRLIVKALTLLRNPIFLNDKKELK